MRSRRAAPVQAPEVTITTPRFDMIAGNEHVRRAAEVALAGGHPICLIGGWEAQAFAAVVDHYGGTAYAIKPCFCGNYGDPEQSCACTLEQIAAYAIRPDLQEALAAPISVEAVRAPTEKILTILARGRFGEPDELLLERVQQATSRPLPPSLLDETCQSLMKAALRQLHLDQGQAERMVTLAQTIAWLANQPRIGPAHLAEALQYRRRR
jgi:predicted ATPase with chaperone activity